MLVCVFVGFAEIFLRLFIESLLATERTEVKSLPVVLGCASGSCGVNIHSADGIMYSSCHLLSPYVDWIILLKDIVNKSHITQSLVGISAYVYFSISYPACSHSTMPPARFQILVYPSEASSFAASSLIRPLRQYKTISAFLSEGN